ARRNAVSETCWMLESPISIRGSGWRCRKVPRVPRMDPAAIEWFPCPRPSPTAPVRRPVSVPHRTEAEERHERGVVHGEAAPALRIGEGRTRMDSVLHRAAFGARGGAGPSSRATKSHPIDRMRKLRIE